MAFNDEVKKYGSVSAALAAKGYAQNDKGAWTKNNSAAAAKPAAETAKQPAGTAVTSMTKRDADNAILSEPGGSIQYKAADGTTGTLKNMGRSWEPGVDYSQRAYDAAAEQYAKYGYIDADYIDDLLMRRQDKMDATGSNGGGVSNQMIWNDIMTRYNGAIGPGKSTVGVGGQTGSQAAVGTPAAGSGSIGQGYSGTEADGYDSFADFADAMGYGDISEQTQAAIKAAVENAVAGYNGQIETVNQDSDDLARQAYIAKMQGQKNLGQQLAANGYAGGMADSQWIATETGYQNDLMEIERQRADTVKELELAITQAQLTGDMQTAQELSGYLQTLQGQWNNYLQTQMQMENQNRWNQQQVDTQSRETAYTRAMNLLGSGIMPDQETLDAAEISTTEASAIYNLYLNGGVPAVQTPGTPEAPRAPQANYNNGSLSADQVRELQNALGVTADGLWGANSTAAADGMTADEAWEAYQNQLEGKTGYNEVLADVQALRGAGESAANINRVIAQAQAAGMITYAQANELRRAYVGTAR